MDLAWVLPGGQQARNNAGRSKAYGTQAYATDKDENGEEIPAENIHIPNLNVGETQAMLERILTTNIVPFLWGPPGVGKSTIVRDICAAHKWELIDLRLSLLNPVDLRGLPVVDKENKQADWYAPSFLPKEDTKTVGVLFLDEINLAPVSVQAAAYQLILDKKVGEYRFPKTWKIVAAGNRETDQANVFKMPAPLSNRFVHLTVNPHIIPWKKWAVANGIHVEIIDFLNMNPQHLYKQPEDGDKAFPSPRSWDFTSQLLTAFDYVPNNPITDELKQAIVSSIGNNVGRQFIVYLGSYHLKNFSQQIKDFIKTGKIRIPSSIDETVTLSTAALTAYHEKEMSKQHYTAFKNMLSNEVREMLDEIEDKYGDELDKKFTTAKPDGTQVSTKTINELPASYNMMGADLYVENIDIFKSGSAVIFGISPNKPVKSEGLEYRIEGDHLRIIGRGRLQTETSDWPAGSLIQDLR